MFYARLNELFDVFLCTFVFIRHSLTKRFFFFRVVAMPAFTIQNVDVFNGVSGLDRNSKQSFQGSPGNILPEHANTDVIIDGSGCTLMPGLIDCKQDIDSSLGALSACAISGITTVIDSSSTNIERHAMHSATFGNPELPCYLATGSAIGSEGASLLGVVPIRSVLAVKTPAEAKRAVAGMVSASETGRNILIIVDQPGLDAETIAAAVAAAHEYNCQAIGQASQTLAYRMALDAAFDIVIGVPVDGTLNAEIVRGFARGGVGVIPTLAYLREAIRRANNHSFKFSYAAAAVKQLHDAGVPICAGTSTNVRDGTSMLFRQSMLKELQSLVTAGLTNLEVLLAATRTPSIVFKLHDRGSITVGNRADLILIDGDPVQDLAVLNKVLRVWVAGVEISINN